MKKLYIIISLIIIGIIGLFFGINQKYSFFQTNDVAKRIYTQGLEDIKNNDLQNAYFNFSKISQFSAFYEAALFRQGLIASELNDYASAIMAYETLLEKFPNTFFKEKTIYNLAIAYYKNEMPEKAYANFQLITKKYANSDYADASNYFLGALIENEDKDKATEHFINYIKIAPNGKYALNSIEELLKIRQDFTSEQNLLIGAALLANNKSNEALKYLNMSRLSDAWGYLTIAYDNIGNHILADKILSKGISEYSKNNDEIQQQAIEEHIKFYGKNTQKLTELKTLCDKSKCQLNDFIMYNLIPSADKPTKIVYYNRIYEEFPQGNYAADALFNSLFNDYTNGSYENAIIKARKHISKYADKKSAPAAMYWLGKTYDKKKNHQEANIYYNRVVNKYPDTYYAYLAAMRLNKVKNPYEINAQIKLPQKPIYINLPILHANLPINSYKKIDELLQIGDFKIFEYSDFDNEIIKSWVAYYEGNLTKASVTAEKVLEKEPVKPTFYDDIYKLIYPVGYAEIINDKANENSKISPYLLISIIRKESRFNQNAVSSAGALGLMQLMPDTASFISIKNGIKYSRNDLFNPEKNINLGVNYYNYIKTNHHSSDLYALASYNGGHNAVSTWINKIDTNDPEEFVERIPYQETKDYIKQIYKNYWVYNSIYNSSKIK